MLSRSVKKLRNYLRSRKDRGPGKKKKAARIPLQRVSIEWTTWETEVDGECDASQGKGPTTKVNEIQSSEDTPKASSQDKNEAQTPPASTKPISSTPGKAKPKPKPAATLPVTGARSLAQSSSASRAAQERRRDAPIIPDPKHPYTVSLAERERYQRRVLGMSEAQIERANRWLW